MLRVLPVIKAIRDAVARSTDLPGPVCITVDTRRAATAAAAVDAGADAVNDVSGGTFDPNMLPTVAEVGVPLVLMHMRWESA